MNFLKNVLPKNAFFLQKCQFDLLARAEDTMRNSQDVSSVDERPAAVDEVDTTLLRGYAGKPGLGLGLRAVYNPVLPAPTAF